VVSIARRRTQGGAYRISSKKVEIHKFLSWSLSYHLYYPAANGRPEKGKSLVTSINMVGTYGNGPLEPVFPLSTSRVPEAKSEVFDYLSGRLDRSLCLLLGDGGPRPRVRFLASAGAGYLGSSSLGDG
jgi:hypothetical protein